MKYYIIAGEASGDLHAANLLKELKAADPDAEFRGWGGDLMMMQGTLLVKHYRDLAFMGFSEVVKNIGTIYKNLQLCKEDILRYKPDVLILVDYPGFNLRIAEFAKQKNIKVFYYISPQVWAWKQSRVHKIKQVVDKMFVILPFEEEFYEKFHYKVDFVGHPLLDAIEDKLVNSDGLNKFLHENDLENKPIVALLPGSRKQEIKTMLSVMLGTAKSFPDHQFVVAGAPSVSEDFYKKLLKNSDVRIVYNKTYDLLKNAAAALVTSGTATLETALFQVPQTVCYSAGNLSYHIAKKLIKVKYISLVNLIMDKEVVKELIQKDFSTEKLKEELHELLYNYNRIHRIKQDYNLLRNKLGGRGASKKAAHLMWEYLNEKN